MRSLKMLGALLGVVALSAIGVANASAAEFTASTEGNLVVKSNQPQVFSTSTSVTCKKIVATGKAATSGTSQHVTAHYSECTGPFSSPVHITEATYNFTANGVVHIKNTITITATTFIGTCHQTVTPQEVETVTYIDNADGTVTLTPHVTGIDWHGTGGACGTGGTAGTYTGDVTVGVEGGTADFDK